MNEQTIISIDSSSILNGKMEDVKDNVKKLVDFVNNHEKRILFYEMYIDENENRMTVAQVHPDSASMEAHLEAANSVFSEFVGLIELQTMDVYGNPREKLVNQLEKKVQMLGTASLSIHKPKAGFSRLQQQKEN